MTAAWFWPVLLGVLGLLFGSFIATVAIRWPEGRSALAGRSMCDACGATLRPHELVPVVSYLAQHGRCRRCGTGIAPSHLAVELIACAIGVATGLMLPGWGGVAGAVFGWLLLALAAIDLAAFWLPDELTGALALAGLAVGLIDVAPPIPLETRLIGGVAGYAALQMVRLGYRRLRGREGLGGGDPKLFGAIGLWLGWEALPTVLLLACVVGLVAVVAMRLAGRAVAGTDRLPLGLLLALSAWTIWLGVAHYHGPREIGPVIMLVPKERG